MKDEADRNGPRIELEKYMRALNSNEITFG